MPVPVIILVVDLGDTLTVFVSIGIGVPATIQFTTGGSLKTFTALGAVPVKISLKRTARTACKVPPHVETPSAVAWWTGGMTPWMIAGTSLFTNNLCGEFPFVVSVKTFPSLVLVATFRSLARSLTASSSSLELLKASTSSLELLMASTSSSESLCEESLIVDWIVNPLNYFIVSAWMSEAIRLSFVTFVSFLCVLIVKGDWKKVSIVTLLTLHAASFSSFYMNLLTASWRFLLENGVPWRSLSLSRESNIFIKYSSLAVAIHAL